MIEHQFEDSPFFNILPKGKKTTFKNKRVGVRLLGVVFFFYIVRGVVSVKGVKSQNTDKQNRAR